MIINISAGSKIKLDDVLSATSENGLQNKVVAAELEKRAKSDLSNASGTLGGQVVANATAVTTIGTAQVRNIKAGTADLTAGSSALATGEIYFVYE